MLPVARLSIIARRWLSVGGMGMPQNDFPNMEASTKHVRSIGTPILIVTFRTRSLLPPCSRWGLSPKFLRELGHTMPHIVLFGDMTVDFA